MAEISKNTLPLEECVVKLLKEKGLTITTAESCTGGLLSGRLINVSGVSEQLKEAYVTYCDEAKQKLLGVNEETLAKYTAVSRETAEEMAIGGAKAANADICLSVTGVAGPNDEGADFPAGLVYIGCCFGGKTVVRKYQFYGGRMEVREHSVEAALCLVLELLTEKGDCSHGAATGTAEEREQ